MTTTDTALQELVNSASTVHAFGRSYEIKKFGLGQACRAVQYIGPLGYLFQRLMAFPRDKKGNIKAGSPDMAQLAIEAISISGESILGLISVATCEPIEWLDDKDLMEGLDVLVAVIEKNADFFSPESIKRLTDVFGRLQHKIPLPGGDTSTS